MNANQMFELECFQDFIKNKYIHPFYKTNRGHLIIAGDNQYKNNYILGYILRHIPYQYNSKDLKIFMYSMSINQNHYPELIKYFKKPIINSRDQLLSLLLWVKNTMNKRYSLFRKLKAKDIYIFNQKAINKEINKRSLPHILFIIHEIPQTDDKKNDPVNNLIHDIIIKSRAAGIHLIMASSNIMNSINPLLKHHMDGIIFKVDTEEKSKILIGSDEAMKIKINEVMIHENLSHSIKIFTLIEESKTRKYIKDLK
jgi:hypothetical protein